MQKYTKYILILMLAFILFSPVIKAEAVTCTVDDNGVSGPAGCVKEVKPGEYTYLAPLGGVTTFNPDQPKALGAYLNLIIKLIIGLAAVMAVVMIIMGGIEYMTSELGSSKEAGKDKITDAIFGLVLALGAYALLYTINPDLLNSDIEIPGAEVNVGLVTSIYDKPITPANTARCVPVASGPCATSNLSSFGSKAEGMSKICNIESGGNAGAASGTDIGVDGTVFSFGLFQINLLANGSVIKDSSGNLTCKDLFVRSDGSAISGTNYIKRDSAGKYVYDAKLKPGMEAQYNSCKATLLNPAENTRVAGVLFQQGTSAFNNSMFAWKGDMGVCSSAFE